MAKTRKAALHRKTKETDIKVSIDLDGAGAFKGSTGVGFLDHMLELFARHGMFDLNVQGKGDLHIDPHHTVEDVRRWFAALKELADAHGLPELSMGTSQDYAVAAQEGATVVRIGSRLFR